MNRSFLHALAATGAALFLSTAHASGCPWLGENVPYDAASDAPAPAVTASESVQAFESDYVFSEANFPPMATATEVEQEATLVASFDPLEAP